MNFLDKLGKVLMKNIGYTITLIVALVFFLYFTEGDLIAGIFTAVCALVIYACIMLLYKEYKNMSAPKTIAKKVIVKKASAKKSKKK
ncbi:MAG: hypothetical protein IKN73_01715 [Alphaproteobacteria bacterium]|nr:hypothetical protein [Alphaproteobacteria bacterium]